MQFKVPQFIDIEDKIFGPLTWKQFAYTLGGVGVVYLVFRVTNSNIVAFIISLPLGGFFAALAFFKYNGKNFIDLLQDGAGYLLGSKVYTWQKSDAQSRDEVLSSAASIGAAESQAIKLGKSNLDEKLLKIENAGNAAGIAEEEIKGV